MATAQIYLQAPTVFECWIIHRCILDDSGSAPLAVLMQSCADYCQRENYRFPRGVFVENLAEYGIEIRDQIAVGVALRDASGHK